MNDQIQMRASGRIRISATAEAQLRAMVDRRDELSRRSFGLQASIRKLRRDASDARLQADRIERAMPHIRAAASVPHQPGIGADARRKLAETAGAAIDREAARAAGLRGEAAEFVERAGALETELRKVTEVLNPIRRLLDAILAKLGARSIRQVLVDYVDVEAEMNYAGELAARAGSTIQVGG